MLFPKAHGSKEMSTNASLERARATTHPFKVSSAGWVHIITTDSDDTPKTKLALATGTTVPFLIVLHYFQNSDRYVAVQYTYSRIFLSFSAICLSLDFLATATSSCKDLQNNYLYPSMLSCIPHRQYNHS